MEKDSDGNYKDQDYKPESIVISLFRTERSFRDRFENSFQVKLDVNVAQVEPSRDSALSSEEREYDSASYCLLPSNFNQRVTIVNDSSRIFCTENTSTRSSEC